MITDTYIDKTHIFKIVLSLTLLNSLRFLQVEEKK